MGEAGEEVEEIYTVERQVGLKEGRNVGGWTDDGSVSQLTVSLQQHYWKASQTK